jgi:predicted DNA-binding transcriptional regulator AlpA
MKDLTPDSTPPPDCALADENDEQLDRSARAGHTPPVKSIRLLRLRQVMQQTRLKKTKLYELQKRGSFPTRIQITSNSVGRVEEEANAWIAGRVAASKPPRIK